METIETSVAREERDVKRRLAELQLDRSRLLKVRTIAMSAAADATKFHPLNAAGTFSYLHGTFGLRNEFVGEFWKVDRADGIESIRNEQIKVSVAFSNVDIACNDDQIPKPRSRKGSGAERAFSPNLFGHLPMVARRPGNTGWATYYLMVDEKGAAELSRPTIVDGTFISCIERIYLSNGDDLEFSPLGISDTNVADNFDPQVVRRQ